MTDLPNKKVVVYCSKCGKKLLCRYSNGLWEFKFGKYGGDALVDIKIHGSLQIVCLRKSCRHVNTFHCLPVTDNQSL